MKFAKADTLLSLRSPVDFYDNVVMHTVDYDWPGKGVHYGIYKEMLLIDVITTVPPIIRRVSDNEAR